MGIFTETQPGISDQQHLTERLGETLGNGAFEYLQAASLKPRENREAEIHAFAAILGADTEKSGDPTAAYEALLTAMEARFRIIHTSLYNITTPM